MYFCLGWVEILMTPLIKDFDFCKLLRLCAISALQISKNDFATFDFFCKNEACVNCGKETATTLTWLPSRILVDLCRQVTLKRSLHSGRFEEVPSKRSRNFLTPQSKYSRSRPAMEVTSKR